MGFYAVRMVHAVLSCLCMVVALKQLKRFLHPRIASLVWLISLSNSGLWVAQTALLPSSFSGILVWLVLGYWLQERYAAVFMAVGISALFGWPFVAISVLIPCFSRINLETLLVSGRDSRRKKNDDDDNDDDANDHDEMNVKLSFNVKWSLWMAGRLKEFVLAALLISMYLLLPMLILDYHYYGRITLAQLNLIFYNVFRMEEGGGPDLYGTEPWYFYLVNCLLHFHVWFLFSLAAYPLARIAGRRYYTAPSNVTARSFLGVLSHLTLPFYLGLFIFSWQAHKEERFLYVLYPWIILNAAIGIFCLELCWKMGKFGRYLKWIALAPILALTVSRLVAVSSHNRVIPVYTGIISDNNSATICLGSEWYRFPSHFFLESNQRIGFLRSPFRGLLPAYYYNGDNDNNNDNDDESTMATATYKGRVNPLNREEMDRYASTNITFAFCTKKCQIN